MKVFVKITCATCGEIYIVEKKKKYDDKCPVCKCNLKYKITE